MTRRELIRLLASLPAVRSPFTVEAVAPRQGAAGDEPPVIPVGLDSYLMWERWPYQRIGARAYMRSTYDRTGGNEGQMPATFFTSWLTTLMSPSMSRVQ